VTTRAEATPDGEGRLRLKARLATNGSAFLVLTPTR
jgi:hypothetical protein